MLFSLNFLNITFYVLIRRIPTVKTKPLPLIYLKCLILGAHITFNNQCKRVAARKLVLFATTPVNKTYCCFLNCKTGFVLPYPDYFTANTGTPSTIVQYVLSQPLSTPCVVVLALRSAKFANARTALSANVPVSRACVMV